MQQSTIKCRNRAGQGLCGRADGKNFFLSRWRTGSLGVPVLKDGFRSREYVDSPAARAAREVTSVVTKCGYVSNNNYWSSTANDSNNHYNVNFNSSCNVNNNNDDNNNNNVKCVK